MACEQPRLSTLVANHDQATLGALVGVAVGGLVLGAIATLLLLRWRGLTRNPSNQVNNGSFLKLQGSISSTRKPNRTERWSSMTSSAPRAVKRLSNKFAGMHKELTPPKPIAQNGGERNYSPRLDAAFPTSPGFPLGPLGSGPGSGRGFTESDKRHRKYSEASEYASTTGGTPMGSLERLERQKTINESPTDHDSLFHHSILDGQATIHAHSTAYENNPWGYTAGSGSLSHRHDVGKRPTVSVSTTQQGEPQQVLSTRPDIRVTLDEYSPPKTPQSAGDQTPTPSHVNEAKPVEYSISKNAVPEETDQIYLSPVAERGLARQGSSGRAASSASFYKEQATRHFSLAHKVPGSPILSLPDSPGGVIGDVARENNNFSFARGYSQHT